MKKDLDKRTFQVLEQYGVTLAEHYIMSTIGYRTRVNPEMLAQFTLDNVEGDSRGNFFYEEYLQAIDACISKGWLEIFTPESHQKEVERQKLAQFPELFDDDFEVGDVDFTENGYLLFRRSIVAIFGQEHIEHSDSGWNRDDERREFEILAGTLPMCQKRIEEVMACPSLYIGHKRSIISVTEPEQIGEWKPNPFITLSNGLRSKINYSIEAD